MGFGAHRLHGFAGSFDPFKGDEHQLAPLQIGASRVAKHEPSDNRETCRRPLRDSNAGNTARSRHSRASITGFGRRPGGRTGSIRGLDFQASLPATGITRIHEIRCARDFSTRRSGFSSAPGILYGATLRPGSMNSHGGHGMWLLDSVCWILRPRRDIRGAAPWPGR